MRRVVAAFVLGLMLSLALPVVSQVSYPVALWPIADATNANRVVRERLFAARTYYVRTDGHDTNCDGKTNASDASTSTTNCAFLLIQKAWDVAETIDCSGYAITAQLGDGTFTAGLLADTALVGCSMFTLQGNSSTPTNVVISTTSTSAITAYTGSITVKDFKVTTATSGFGVLSCYGALITFSGIDFGSVVSAHIRTCDGGRITVSGNYTISGGASQHFQSYQPGIIRVDNRTITSTGTFSFGVFAEAGYGGILQASGITFTGGTITGTRYSANTNGVINSGGCTASYFPGNAAGSTATGGWCL